MILRPTTADGDSPVSRKIHLIAAQVVCMSVTAIIVGLRLYARATIRAIGSDDWLILVALLLAILFTICICFSTTVGWTYHLEDVDNKIPALTVAWIAQLLFTPAVSTVKMSILIFYLRLSTSKTFRSFVFGGMIFVGMWFISFETVIAMTCDTPEDPVGFTGSRMDHCVSNRPTTKYHGITNILTDFFVYFLPIPLVWGLNMPPRRRFGLIFVFAVGGIVCIFGTLRLIFSLTVDSSSDYTWEGFYLWLFAALELDLGIICASAPALKMFVVRSIQNSSSDNRTVPNMAQPTPPRISQFIGNNVRNQGLTSLCSVEVSVGALDETTGSRNSMYGMRRGSLAPKRNSDIIEDETQREEQSEASGGITKTVEFSFREESTSNGGEGSVGSQRASTSRAGSTGHPG